MAGDIDRVGEGAVLCAKTLIFTHSINNESDIYSWLTSRVREMGFRDGFVSMFHTHIAEPLQQYMLSEFSKPDSIIRVLVSTVAFGMGVTVGNVRQVGKFPHWWPSGRKSDGVEEMANLPVPYGTLIIALTIAATLNKCWSAVHCCFRVSAGITEFFFMPLLLWFRGFCVECLQVSEWVSEQFLNGR